MRIGGAFWPAGPLAFLLLALLAAGLGPMLPLPDPYAQDFAALSEPPSARHLLGTDEIGGDVLARLLLGCRLSLTFGLFAALVALIAGGLLGLAAMAIGGAVEVLVFAVVDLVRAMPGVLFALAMVAALEPGTLSVVLALGVSFAPIFARIAVMQAGRVVEEAGTGALFANPLHPHSKALLAAHRLPALRNRAVGEAEVLACEEVSIDYPGRFLLGGAHRAVSGASFSLRAGETLGLVGESGSGKSSIARAIMGLLPVAEGRVSLFGNPLPRRRDPGHARCQIVFQDSGGSLNPRLTIGRIVAEPLDLRGLHRGAVREERLAALMREVGLDPGLLLRYPHQLSGGQRQRVNIARALALDPDVLLCDEIVSALDATVQAQILALLAAIQARRKLAILFISHDLGVIRAVSHRVAVMQHGRIIETAETEALFTHPAHPTTSSLLAARLGVRLLPPPGADGFVDSDLASGVLGVGDGGSP